MKKYALGIYIDGTVLHVALLSNQTGRPRIENLERFQLYGPLEQREIIEQHRRAVEASESVPKNDDPFGMNALFKRTDSIISDADSKNNVDIIHKILTTVCPKGTQIGFNLSEVFTFYKHLPPVKEATGYKSKKAVWQAFTGEMHSEPKHENLGYYPLPDQSIFALLHDDPLVFSSLLLDSISMLHSTPPKIKLVDSVEYVLAHEILHTFKLTDQDHTAVILFSSSCTRIFFMRGHLIHTVLPTIYEGSESETVCDTAFAKILFEFDTGKLVALNRIILAGDSSRLRAETYFRDKWPAANVTRLEMVRPVLDEKLEAMEGRISSYAVPIALALKTLDEHPKAPYDHNFLPARIREKQSVYRIAWHGVLLLCILFMFVIFMTYQSVRSSQNLNRARSESRMLSMQLMDLQTVAMEVDSLRAKIMILEKGTALIDSLNKNTLRWTPVLRSFAEAFQKAGPFSIIKAESNNSRQMVVTLELNREEQIAALERVLRPFTVTSVVRNTEADDRWMQVEFSCMIN
jgi:hypothetical protein